MLLELPGNRLWAIELKRGLAPKVERGLRVALYDLHPERAFLVYSADARHPKGDGIEAIRVGEMAREVGGLAVEARA